MNETIESPAAWSEQDPLVVLKTSDDKPFALGRSEGGKTVALDTHDYTRAQIGWLRSEVEKCGGIGSYQEAHRRYIMNVFHGELGMAG